MEENNTRKSVPTFIGPLVFAADLVIAAALWFFRDFVFGPGQDSNAAIVALFIAFSGLVVFLFIRNLSRKAL